jgi:hypothetical protein
MSNYNIDPYFDDFEPTKNYVKVLFKPGVPVQARELTQMQSAIQQQIKSIGGFLFKNESLVLGGESSRFNVVFVDVVKGDISDYVGKILISQTNKSKIKVVAYKNNVSAGVSRLYFSYLNGNKLSAGEILNENATVTTVGELILTNNAEHIGTASAFKLQESVFYVKDYFVVAPSQTIILSDNALPTVKVGLRVTEQIISYQEDETLLDPSSGTLNYAAPGADRVQISLDLVTASYNPVAESDAELMIESTEDNFIELARYRAGVLIKSLKNPNLGALEDVLARRTYDESGNYTVKPFKAKITNNVKKDVDKLSISIEPGKAYVKGYEFETTSTITIDLDKARDYESEENSLNEAAYGDYFIVNNPTGTSIDYSAVPQISIRNSSNTQIGTAYVSFVKAISTTQLRVYVTNVVIDSPYSISQANNLYSNPWTAVIDTANTEKLYRAKKSPLLIKLKDSPTKSVVDTSYISQIKTSGTATATTLSPSISITTEGKAYISSDPLDYVVIKQDGTRATSISSVSVSGSSFTLTGSFTNGAVYDIYAKISVSTQAKGKTRTSTTVYLTNSAASKITLGVSDVYRIVSIVAKHSTNTGTVPIDVTNKYSLDNGQRDYVYDNASLVLKPGNLPASPSIYNRLVVTLEYFVHGSSEGYFSINSYDITNSNDNLVVPYENIPSFNSASGELVSLRDVIDFRPRRANIANFPGTEGSPIGTTVSSNIVGSEICEPGNYVTTDYEYYLARTDKLIITKEKRFDLIRGVPSKNPSIPADLPDAMTIYNIQVPAYTFSAREVKLEFIENKRYTMKDIGKIDNRVSRVEYYTAMSLLEKQASDETILNASGMDKFKNGILVDSFAGFGVSDVGSAQYSASIDSVSRILRPRFAKQTVEFDINRSETSSSAYSLEEELITLPYSTEVILNNSQPTNWADIQRYASFEWNGEIKLSPSSDTWSDQTQLPDVVVNVNGNNDAFTVLADNVENPASTGVKWADWQFVDKGVDVSTAVKSSDNVKTELTNGTSGKAIQTTATTTTTTTTTTVNDLYYASGIEVDRSSISTVTRDLGSKVVDTSLATFIRPRIVNFAASKLQPNTVVYTSFDDVEVTSRCVQAPAIYLKTVPGATKVRKSGTSKEADVILLKSNKAFVKMVSGEYLFEAGDSVEWYKKGSWVSGETISDVVYSSTASLATDEAGDIAGYFSIPASTFRTGERVFRIADDLGDYANTAAEAKYVAMGLAMSLQKDIISTRVQTVSINPVSKTKVKTTVNVSESSTVSTVKKDVTVRCGDTATGSGRSGKFTYDIDFGTDIGSCGVNYDPSGIPDRYTIIWNGTEYTTGFRGDSAYNSQLNSRGYPSVTSVINDNNPVSGKLRFKKTSIFPTKAQLIVDAPLAGTAWKWKIVCPGKTDNLLPETTPTLDVVVDTPASVTLSYTGTNTDGVVSLSNPPTAVTYKFTISVSGNQTIPDGTPITLNSLTRTEQTNGRWSSFVSGTTFRYNGNVVSLPMALVTGKSYTFEATFETTSNARNNTTTIFGTTKAPICTISANVSLVTAVEGTNAADSGSDTTTVSSTWILTYVSTATFDAGTADDPLAQTFFVSSRENPDGIFVDSVDLFLKKKSTDEDAPITVSIRTTVNGYPSSSEVLPLATCTKHSREITVSEPSATTKVATNFKFEAPIFLSPDTEYALVVGSPVNDFQLYISRIGEFLLGSPNVRATKQPLTGSIFYSGNGRTWTAEQTDDLCMRLRKCVFPVNTVKSITLNSVASKAQMNSEKIDYDLLFVDGEILDFSSTNVDYYYKTAQLTGSVFSKDSNWTPYQLGSNVTMKSRRSLDPDNGTSLRFLCNISTTNRDVSPVIDLSRLSAALVQNIINNNNNSETENSSATITNVVATTTEVTITTSGSHGFSVGDTVYVSAEETIAVNGIAVLTYASGTTLKYNKVGTASSLAQGGTVLRRAQALSRYITRKVTLNSDFYSDDMKVYFYAKIPSGCNVVPYYRVTSLTDAILEDNPWVPMTLESSGTITPAGYVEYKYKTPYTNGDSDSVALSTGERFGTFAVKLVLLSNDTTKVPLVKDLRVLALTN